MTPRELSRRIAALEAEAAARAQARAADAMDYSVLTAEELRELRGWVVACGDRGMISWTKTLPKDERDRFRFVFGKLVEGQRR